MTSSPRDGAISTLPGFRCHAQRLCVALAIASLPVGCVKQLPPAPTPQPIAPAVEAAAPPPGGHGRLVVDVVEGPTPVQRITMAGTPVDNGRGRTHYRFSEVPATLCAPSPCAVDLPTGNVLLGFPMIGSDEVELELVHVGPEPSVYRRSLSVYNNDTGAVRVLGIIATAVGGTAITAGAVLLPLGLADDHRGLTIAGGINLGAGAALLVAGILAMRADAPWYRPGSSNHFPLATAP